MNKFVQDSLHAGVSIVKAAGNQADLLLHRENNRRKAVSTSIRPDTLMTVEQENILRKETSSMDTRRVAEFKNRVAGEVVVPDSPAYTTLRNVFNQTGSPSVIVHLQAPTVLSLASERCITVVSSSL